MNYAKAVTMPNNQEQDKVIVRILTYIVGVCLGLAARLATMNQEKTLTGKVVFLQSTIAFASAFAVWEALAFTGYKEFAIVCAVVVGRFGDKILVLLWKASAVLLGGIFKVDTEEQKNPPNT